MSRPDTYSKTTNFAEYQRRHSESPYQGGQHDTEFNNIALALGQTQSVLAGVTRDDGALANGVVHPYALSNATLALMVQQNMRPRGAWASGELYLAGDIAERNGGSYVSLIQHVAGTFSADEANGYWQLVANNAVTGVPTAFDKWFGDGSTTDFALTYIFDNAASLLVFVDGAIQIPGIDYTLASGGTLLRFSSAPPVSSPPGLYNVVAAIPAGNNYAGAAATSASDAAASAAAAASSASSAASSASAAASSASSASSSASAAASSESAAASSQSAASASQSAAAASQSAAASSASAAATSASNAATSETNAANSATAAAGYISPVTSVSSTSLTLATGSQSFTIETGKAFVVGHPVKLARTSDAANKWMSGTVTAYNSGTGAMTAFIDTTAGAGTYSDWTVSIAGGSGGGGSGGSVFNAMNFI